MAATTRAGVIVSFDVSPYTAVVQMKGSLSAYLSDVPVARNIASGEMSVGRQVAVLFIDIHNFEDAVVIAVWV